MWGHKKRGLLYKLSTFQVVGNPALSNCTECPRLRLLYTIPFRVRDIYTRAQTFTWQYLQCNSNFLRLRCEDNVCKRLLCVAAFVVPATLSRRRRHDYVRRRHAASRTSTPLQRYSVFVKFTLFLDRFFSFSLSFLRNSESISYARLGRSPVTRLVYLA